MGIKKHKVEHDWLPIGKINVLPQPRKTFAEIETLAEDIRKIGLIHPISVAVFTENDCQVHLDNINDVWHSGLKLVDLQTYKNHYLVLISGERRLRALKSLKEKQVYSSVYREASSLELINIQGSENHQAPIPAHEEADFYDKYYRMKRAAMGGKLAVAKFAKSVGRNPEVIRKAVRFSNLPDNIRKAVFESVISYGIACELARLSEQELDRAKILYWFTYAVARRSLKVKEFHIKISKYLQELKQPDFAHNSLFGAELSVEELQKLERRYYIDRSATAAFYDALRYLDHLMFLFNNDLLGKIDSPFSMTGPTKACKDLLKLMQEKLLPHLQTLLPAGQEVEAEALLDGFVTVMAKVV
ncbi:MAG: ParB/RepB/Spo0J family partition protein [Candidatus Falkowbacteria bacterium]